MSYDRKPLTAVFLKEAAVQRVTATQPLATPETNMAALLSGFVPIGAEPLDMGLKGSQAWRIGDKVYVRTPWRFGFGWEAQVSDSNETYVYRFTSEAGAKAALDPRDVR